MAAIAAAVSVTVALGWWIPVALGYDFSVEYALPAAALIIMSWGWLAGPAVASFLARRSWAGEVRRLRRHARTASPTATWPLHPTTVPRPSHRRCPDTGRRTAPRRWRGRDRRTSDRDQRRPRIRGSGREATFTAGSRPRSLTVRDHGGQILGEITLHRWIWSGYHRATIRTLTFPNTTDTALRAELAADLDPVALAAVLRYLTQDRRQAATDNYWRG